MVLLILSFGSVPRNSIVRIGSDAIAFWSVTLLMMLMIRTANVVWIGLLLVYGIDTVFTFVHRLYLDRTFRKSPHRHFYQLMAFDLRMDHRLVSVIYFGLQLLCSALLIVFYPTMGSGIFWILFTVLGAAYFIKFRLLKIVKHAESEAVVI